MFTSRAEHRLLLRRQRLICGSRRLVATAGLISNDRWERFEARRRRYESNLAGCCRAYVRDHAGDRVTAAQPQAAGRAA